MKRKTVILIVIIINLFLISYNFEIIAQPNNRYDDPISDERFELLTEKRTLIVNENKESQNEWAGTYTRGDHHPTVFMWSENKGFVIYGSHHTGYPSGINYGEAKFIDNRLLLKPEIPKDDLHYMNIADELTPVKWGEQHYLVPSDELEQFAYAVHANSSSLLVEYLFKVDDMEKDAEGLPNLPQQYEEILKMKPIKAQLTSVIKTDKDKIWGSEITLKVKNNSKVIKGMYFFYSDSKQSLIVEVLDINGNLLNAKVVVTAISGKSNHNGKLEKGMKFSSKAKKGSFS